MQSKIAPDERNEQGLYETSSENADCKQTVFLLYLLYLSMNKYITVSNNIMSGAPVIRGTRIPIERILFLIKDGYNIDAIHQEYPHVARTTLEGVIDEIAQSVITAHHGTSLS